MNSTILKMSDAYETMNLCSEMPEAQSIDCRDISGTKCYLDELALIELQKRIEKVDVNGVHFIDSGNYHYLSFLMLQKIKEPFSLVLVDQHPDMQMPLFGDIISCGGWLLKSIENIDNLKKIYLYGVDEKLLKEVSPLPENVVILEQDAAIMEDDMIPIYLSIDKDALSTSFCITDWDQGNMSMEELICFLKKVVLNRRLIGVDICGDTSKTSSESDRINMSSNKALIDFFGDFL